MDDTSLLNELHLSIFISHSSKDEELARALIDLLQSALHLPGNEIRCSSVDGYRLPLGAHTDTKLREEVNSAKVVVGLLTPNSLASPYVMFELGARWGSGFFIAPISAGLKPGQVSAPLSQFNVLNAEIDAQLYQFVDDIAERLGNAPQSPAIYSRHIEAVKRLAATKQVRDSDLNKDAQTGDAQTQKALSDDALQMLLAAANSGGTIRAERMLDGEYRISAGNKALRAYDGESKARYEAVLEELIEFSTIKQDSKEHYSVNVYGYEVATAARLLKARQSSRSAPFDEFQSNHLAEILHSLNYMQRDLLRLLLLKGGTVRSDVIHHARVNQSDGFDLNGLYQQLILNGLITREDDHLSGYPTIKIAETDALKGLLLPRIEGNDTPYFKGIPVPKRP